MSGCKKIFLWIFMICSCFCIAAGEQEVQEYAFFAKDHKEAESIAAKQGGELISFCQGIGVLRKSREAAVQIGQEDESESVRLYPDEIFTVDIQEEPQTQIGQWHLDVLEMQEVWKKSTGKGVKVAVIDSGIDSEHEDLKEGIVYVGTAIPQSEYGDGKRFDGAYQGTEDHFGHGTHVAGIIGARNNGTGCTGIAPDCSLISVKALEKQGSTGKGKTSWVASAIRMAVEQEADVINLSLGGSSVKNELLYTVIKEALEKNIPVVCAAGNISGKQMVFYPGAYPETIAVSALKSDNGYVSFASAYSNYGDWIDISAPGTSIMSTIPGGYGTKNGTSMACPMVAGGVALLLEKKSDLTAEEICNLLCSSATDLGETGKDDKYGHGAVNLKNMMKILDDRYGSTLPQPVFKDQSVIRKGTAIGINAPASAQKLVYTTDGTIPDADSAVYPAEGIVFPAHVDEVTIRCRCILSDGTLGEEISVSYTFVECESILQKNGSRTEVFPDYGNYTDEKTGFVYKRYEISLNPGENLTFQLKSNGNLFRLSLYDDSSGGKQLAMVRDPQNKDLKLKWKNESDKAKKVYLYLILEETVQETGKISYEIAWEINNKNASQEDVQTGNGKEEAGEDIFLEEKLPEEKKNIQETKKLQGTEAEAEQTLKEKETVIYEDDWLYAMDGDESPLEEKETVSENSVSKNHTVSRMQEEDWENTTKEEKNIGKYIFSIILTGIGVEILVILWNIQKKKKDGQRENERQP